MSTQTTEPKKTELVIVGPCRLSYANIWKARKNLKNEMQYDVVLLFPKENNEFCPDAKKSIKAAMDGIKACAGLMIPAGAKYGVPFMDGDRTGKNAGHYYMTAKSSFAPAVVNPAVQPITEQDEWASGDWANVVVNFYAGEFNGTWNIGCGLRSIQFAAHDEHFASGTGGSGIEKFTPIGETPGTEKIRGQDAPPNVDEYDPFADE